MKPVDLDKHHTIALGPLPAEQIDAAARHLNTLGAVFAVALPEERCISVRYALTDWTLEALEANLIAAGFSLTASLPDKLRRAVVHYTEEVQLENLQHPERLRKTKEAYVQAWEKHPHGDHDDTPEELRRCR